MSISPKPLPVPKPTPKKIIIGSDSYEFVAFYFPGSYEPWDSVCNAPFCGNFWLHDVTITIKGETATFHTSEAAFQATKWWDKVDVDHKPIRPKFEACVDGDAAFKLKTRLAGNPKRHIPAQVPPDLSYAGLGRDEVMRRILKDKFADPTLQAALIATGGAYLLEHNADVGRDDYWSDNNDGTGQNMLGILLMELRGELNPPNGEPSPAQAVSEFTKQII